MAYHLSIFVENKPGKLERVTKIFEENQVNIQYISVASLGEFGMIKTIVDKTDTAYDSLRAQGFTVSKRKIVIACIDDKPGSLHSLLNYLSSNNINIDDCYGYPMRNEDKVAMVIEAEVYPEIEKILSSNQIVFISSEENY